VYDEDTKEVVRSLFGEHFNENSHSNRIFALKFLANEPNLLLSAGWDANVNVWDLREKKQISSFYTIRVSGDSLDFKNGQLLVGGNRADNQLQLWDFGT
jgi:WD40 repeat protein